MIVTALLVHAVMALALAKPFDRERRDPSRAMTWTGWMPGSGMSVYASSEDPWGQAYDGLKPPPAMGGGWGFQDAGSFEESPKVKPFDEELGKPKKPIDDDKEVRPIKPFHSKPRKNYDDEYDERRYGSNANASFNAWFPIMLGMYPGSENRSRGSDSRRDDGSVAAIANSVNHGRSGVASSHAIVYSGQPPNSHDTKKF